jgi:calcineurin-like phosphoesterase family protein
MTIWFTSDTHFWHKAIVRYCNRPIPPLSQENDDPTQEVQVMNEWLIQRWNARIRPEDDVWHLGDFFFCGKEKAVAILERLNGKKHWILGNHDYGLAKKVEAFFEEPPRNYKFLRVNLPYEDDEGNNQQYSQPIILCHFPILSWDGMAHGSWHLHGHCHGSIDSTWNRTGLRMDVGVDAELVNWQPINLVEIQTRMALRTVAPVDHHNSSENNPRFKK